MKLRPYQQAAVDAVIESWKTHRSCLVVLPTGCGKTVVFAEVLRRRLERRPDMRCMILAHREELVRQAQEKVHAVTLADVAVEMGAYVAGEGDLMGGPPPVVVSTVQTQITGRMNKFDPADFYTLVIDEAHHAVAGSYRACVEHYFENEDCRLLGVTATPDRADEAALGKMFDAVAYEYSVTDAVRDGWLVPVRQKLVEVESLDFSRVGTTAGDFNQGELADVLEKEQNLHGIADPTVKICGGRRAIVFASSVRQAERLSEILNRHRENCSEWVCGKTDKIRRGEILRRFREGATQFVVNVGVLTEGFDDAGVEVVVMARPTKSRALYAQMAGRATRPAAEIAAKLGESADAAARRAMIAASSKPSCLIVDFVGNSGRHKLVSMVDILGGKYADDEAEDEARRRVKRRCAADVEVDPLAALDEERASVADEIEARKAEEARRRKFIVVTATFTERSVDPFNAYDIPPPTPEMRDRFRGREMSFKQRAFLEKCYGAGAERVDYATGKAMIDEFVRRRDLGLATPKQTACLRKRGIDAPMTHADASWTIGRMMASWRGAK